MPKLPTYLLTVDDLDPEQGLMANSFVDHPAHRKSYLTFRNQEEPIPMFFNEEKRIVMGVAIATEEPIYRRDPDGREYYVQFDEVNTRKIALKALKDGAINTINLDHDGQTREGAYLCQSIIVDSSVGITPPDAFADHNLADGSWIVGYKVEDDKLWDEIKSRKGFSVEVFVNEQIINQNKQEMKTDENKTDAPTEAPEKGDKLSFKERVQQMFTELFGEEKQFASAVTSDGLEVQWEGELGAGVVLTTADGDGNQVPVPEGEYLLPNEEGEYVWSVTVGPDGSVVDMKEVEATGSEKEEYAPEEMAEAMRPLMEKMAAQDKTIKEQAETIETLKKEFNGRFDAIETAVNKSSAPKKFGTPKPKESKSKGVSWRDAK